MNRTQNDNPKRMNQDGFTLIELIMVIVILGILAVVAIPKYADLQEEAAVAACEGVYGAAQGAAAINFATMIINSTKAPANGRITNATSLLQAMDGDFDDWTNDGAGFYKDSAGVRCRVYVETAESTSEKAAIDFTTNAPPSP